MAFLDPVLNPLFGNLMTNSPFLVILITAFVVSVLITFVYKLMTDQDLMKAMKDEQKSYQEKIKALKNQPEKMMALQKEMMSKNFDYMKHSFKPTLVTFIPIILIFGWLAGNFAYEPIYPGETYSITATVLDGINEVEILLGAGSELVPGSNAIQTVKKNKVTWRLKSEEGPHEVTVSSGGDLATKKVLITTDLLHEEQFETYSHSDISKIEINYNKLKPLGDFSLFGWKPGFLGWYIILSLVFSIGLRKAFKIH